MKAPIIVRTITEDHLKKAAYLRSLFSESGFLSKIHWRFWENLFHRLMGCPYLIFLEAFDTQKNVIAGFIIASCDFSQTKKIFKSRGFILHAATYIALMCIRYPSKLKDAISVCFGKNEMNRIPDQRWLTWIVHPDYRNKGVGTILYVKLCQRMNKAGVQKFYGPVDCRNTTSNRAHERFKARKVASVVIENAPHYLWEHDAVLGELSSHSKM